MYTAQLKNYRQAPRKVRLVTNLVKGKTVPRALLHLSFINKRAALPIHKLIESAVAGAFVKDGSTKENLMIQNITVNKGVTLHRHRPRARGSASPIDKHCSTIVVVLSPVAHAAQKMIEPGKESKTVVKKTTKNVSTKKKVTKSKK